MAARRSSRSLTVRLEFRKTQLYPESRRVNLRVWLVNASHVLQSWASSNVHLPILFSDLLCPGPLLLEWHLKCVPEQRDSRNSDGEAIFPVPPPAGNGCLKDIDRDQAKCRADVD
jgi:hypothetical protein